jgi:polysaccharide biosynthesis/export protein
MRIRILIALLAFSAVLPGQQEDRMNLPAQPIGPNDLLTVTVYKQPALSGSLRVSAYGTVQLPMLKHEINATGLLPGALSAAVAKAYVDEGILVDPQVTVTIAEYQSHPIQVGGAVKTPVTFQAETPVTLLQAINRAGGLTENAGPDVLVSKKGQLTRHVSVKALFGGGDEGVNLILTGGEEIRLPEAGRVFVVGNVKKPCNYLIADGSESSVLKAMSYAEGLMTYSSKSAYIYRREANGSRNEVEIPLHNILARKTGDVPLLAGDILYVPENGSRKAVMSTLGKVLLIGGGAVVTALVLYH